MSRLTTRLVRKTAISPPAMSLSAITELVIVP